MTQTPCPCGSGNEYSDCCGLYLSGQQSHPTAELLMRSRFTAFALQNETYLLKSWNKNTRPESVDFSQDHCEWQKLEIVMTKKGQPNDAKGVVEFKAYYRSHNQDYVMNEISRFTQSAGEWLYLDGKVKSIGKVGAQVNQGKNAPCPCGSGKKYKRCCGK